MTEPIRKRFILEEVKGIEDTEDGLKVPFVISTGAVDRDKDLVNPQGWDLTNYRKNPVVLWAHDSRTPPVGKSIEETVSNTQLKSVALFTPKDLNPFGYMIGQMYAKGFMRAVSVGFRSDDWEWSKEEGRDWGIDFKTQELLEYSAVPVPANPEAVLEAKGAGIDVSPMLEWAEKVLDGAGIWIPKAQAKKIWGELAQHKTYSMPKESNKTSEQQRPKRSLFLLEKELQFKENRRLDL
ncbi:HK97 family phage prohead protease [Paenibacillus elgii]|uniref:HK97 family phage prohead protease n=1 Tax=Paenibacillus elgii TaxID=189691 RepID=UPI001300C7AF|nr:HK97 family phage prohead protease [Paenibacillus elgii]